MRPHGFSLLRWASDPGLSPYTRLPPDPPRLGRGTQRAAGSSHAALLSRIPLKRTQGAARSLGSREDGEAKQRERSSLFCFRTTVWV